MSNEKNIEIVGETNYSISAAPRTLAKKKHRVLGTVIAILLSLALALITRYFVEIKLQKAAFTPEPIAALQTEIL